jgi:phospholipase/carboxylesterase
MTFFGADDRPHLEETTPSTATADSSGGRLSTRPHSAEASPESPGLHQLDLSGEPVGLLYVPAGYRSGVPAPFVLLLHGAGGDARGGIEPLLRFADDAGLLLLAPDSRDVTWDMIMRSFGPDIALIDRALGHVFSHYVIDPLRVAIGGFSDGASYALSVGVTNGDLFTHVIAFSPGFVNPGEVVGQPRIHITHGVDDRVLPIDRTSRRLAPTLQGAGYDVVYEEFSGGHVVPVDCARYALDWFLA